MRTRTLGAIMRLPLLILALLAISTGLRAQLTNAGRFFGTIAGVGDVYVEAEASKASVFLFDRQVGRVLEFATINLSAQGIGGATSTLGQLFTVGVGNDRATGRVGGLTYTATRQPIIGQYRQIDYTGTLADLAGRAGASRLIILPNARAILLILGGTISGGTGSIVGNTAVLAMTSGTTAVFPLNPDNGVLIGTAAVFGGTPTNYILVEKQRPALLSLASRGSVGSGNILTAGVNVSGGAKTLFIRAIGPGLTPLGVTNAHPDPRLTLYSGNTVIATNDNWGGTAELTAAGAQVGAFVVGSTTRDAMLLVNVEPGGYTAQVNGDGAAGDVIVEVYEL